MAKQVQKKDVNLSKKKKKALRNFREYLEENHFEEGWSTHKEILRLAQKANLKDDEGNKIKITQSDISRSKRNDNEIGIVELENGDDKYILEKRYEKERSRNKLEDLLDNDINNFSLVTEPYLVFMETDPGVAESLGHNFYESFPKIKGYFTQKNMLILIIENEKTWQKIKEKYNLPRG